MDAILSNTSLLISLAVSVVVMLVFFAGYQMFLDKAKARKMKEKVIGKSMFLEQSVLKKRKESSFFRLFQSLGKGMAPKTPSEYSKMRVQFYKAGIRHLKAPHIYYGAKLFLMMSFAAGFMVLRMVFFRAIPPQLMIFLLIIFASAGFYIPDIWLRLRTSNRQRTIFEGFPDALDLMVVCVEAGMGLDSTIGKTGDEMRLSNPDLSDEFRLMSLEVRAGKTREEAFRNLALRTDIEDVKNLVALLVQTDKFGTNIAQALRVFSESFRIKRYQRAEEMAAKLPVKLIFPLVLFIFPSLLVVLLGPAAIRIYHALVHLVDK